MKIVCIDNTIGNSKHFEIGQIVESSEYELPGAIIIIDGKYSKTPELLFNDIWCERRFFISLEEWRETKLNKLLI